MIYIIYFMPQLIPFYFINQVTAAFAILSLMIYIFSKYSLPLTVRLFLARIFVTKL
jgi:F-type H+-transporting ATPase subunit 8